MNIPAQKIMDFLDAHPEFKGKVVGYKGSRGGIGITRIDNDWYECDFYLIEADDAVLALLSKHIPPRSHD